MKKLRIGFFTDSYLPDPNGVATTTAAVATALEKRGHTVYIIAPKHPHFRDKKNVYRLTSVKMYDSLEMRMALHLPDRALIKALQLPLDIIHTHSGGPVSLLGWEVAKLKDIPCLTTYHTMMAKYTHYLLKGKLITPKMATQMSRIFGNMCDCVIAPTQIVAHELRSYGIKKPILVIHNGLDLAYWGKAEKGTLRKKLSIKKGEKILLYVGRLGREKSVDFLIRSFETVHKKLPQTHLVIVGDGPEKENLLSLAKKLNLKQVVHFLGFVSKETLATYYVDADVFVFASTTDTQGMVLFEAMASGIPLVVVNHPTYTDFVKNGYNGFLTNTHEKDFAEAVSRVLIDDKLRKELSENAQKSVARFSVDATAKTLENLYLHILEMHASRKKKSLRHKFKSLRSILDL